MSYRVVVDAARLERPIAGGRVWPDVIVDVQVLVLRRRNGGGGGGERGGAPLEAVEVCIFEGGCLKEEGGERGQERGLQALWRNCREGVNYMIRGGRVGLIRNC